MDTGCEGADVLIRGGNEVRQRWSKAARVVLLFTEGPHRGRLLLDVEEASNDSL